METKHSKENQEPSSYNRRKDVEETEAEDNKMLKITDLDDYCLEEIFNYLDFPHLVNIAMANTTLKFAACAVFKRKFGNFSYKDVRVYLCRDISDCCRFGTREMDKTQCLRLISVFGNFHSFN